MLFENYMIFMVLSFNLGAGRFVQCVSLPRVDHFSQMR